MYIFFFNFVRNIICTRTTFNKIVMADIRLQMLAVLL